MDTPNKTTRRVRGTTEAIDVTARVMRQTPTPAEHKLWQALKGRKLGCLKFRRQHAVGKIILDFYCSQCRLVVELDGSTHDTQAEHDSARTAHLNTYDYRVIRFRNEEVMHNLPSVLKRILDAANPACDLPSPDVGRGAGGEG